MSNRKCSIKTTAVLLLVGVALLFCGSLAFAADKCQIIRIEEIRVGEQRRIEIFPRKINIPVGTCTVWLHFMGAGEVQVSFREAAQQCILSTEAPTGFKEVEIKAGETCYVSEPLPRGKTSSLVWTKPGIFKYTIEKVGPDRSRLAGNAIAEGVIGVIAPETAEAPVDTDGDGVPDSVDLCPGTPKGASVNKNGCWTLKGVVLFDFGGSIIKPEAYYILDEVVVILEKNPEITGELRGHTDSIGSEEHNKQLSEKRAKAVEEYLENKGIDPARLTSVGYGEAQPIASNETPEGRQENRRVELVRTK